MVETTFWILTALAAEQRHGYAILRDVSDLSGGTVWLRVTTLYASLERLTREAKVRVAGEDVVDGRARRYYEITSRGLQDLEAEAERLAVRTAAARARMATQRAGASHPSTAMVAPA